MNAYVGELEALRLHGRELAESFPDVAARLDIGPRRSRDPHVERVVESAAFLAARLRMHLEEQSTELPMALLSILAPTLLEPVPAMAIGELRGGSEAQRIPKGSRFDLRFGQFPLVCLSTTMDITAAPLSIRIKRLGGQGNYADGISLRLIGKPPPTLQFFVGNNAFNAAALLDALAGNLAMNRGCPARRRRVVPTTTATSCGSWASAPTKPHSRFVLPCTRHIGSSPSSSPSPRSSTSCP